MASSSDVASPNFCEIVALLRGSILYERDTGGGNGYARLYYAPSMAPAGRQYKHQRANPEFRQYTPKQFDVAAAVAAIDAAAQTIDQEQLGFGTNSCSKLMRDEHHVGWPNDPKVQGKITGKPCTGAMLNPALWRNAKGKDFDPDDHGLPRGPGSGMLVPDLGFYDPGDFGEWPQNGPDNVVLDLLETAYHACSFGWERGRCETLERLCVSMTMMCEEVRVLVRICRRVVGSCPCGTTHSRH